MFWSGNFIVVRELNFLLKEENVTLSQVLEADDILQECKADNKALMQFLTRPDILAELITLITQEPPAGVELAVQYRHASIACEVLTSPLSSLSDRLSLDTHQMNRLCDFINRDPPLNPLLASYFSKTIEMLLERNPKQDWYLYHIVCLRVLDFFKSRRDFLPNLLRHISTSAIADTFNYFIRLDDLFNKIIMEWLEEHQFIECLIQIICGTYVPETAPSAGPSPEEPEKGTREPSEKHNHTGDPHTNDEGSPEPPRQRSPTPAAGRRRRARSDAVASANACALLCDLVATGCAAEGAAARSRTSWALVGKLAGGAGVRALLQAVFTSAGPARAAALVHGTRLLRQLLDHHPVLGAEGGTSRSQVELAVAPHLPLLHQALLRDPTKYAQEEDGADTVGAESGPGAGAGPGAVGAARIQTAALLAHLASSEVEEVPTTMLTLGTPAVLVDMFFLHPHNNFLHAQLLAFCRNALANPAYRSQYAAHLVVECDLLTRLMDAFEENENKQGLGPRAGHMGHVVLVLACLRAALEAPLPAPLAPALAARWRLFLQDRLEPALDQFGTPLGGTYPSENSYEMDDSISDRLTAYYDAGQAGGAGGAGAGEAGEGAGAGGEGAGAAEFTADGLGLEDDDNKPTDSAKNRFMELVGQRFDDDMWDEAPEAEGEGEAVGEGAPAASLGEGSPGDDWERLRRLAKSAIEVVSNLEPIAWGGDSPPRSDPAPEDEGWAQFENLGEGLAPADPFAHYWPYEGAGPASSSSLEAGLLAGRAEGCVSLATNLLTAMSGMSPADVANIVNANLDLGTLPPADLAPADDKVIHGRVTDPKVSDTSVGTSNALGNDASGTTLLTETTVTEAFSQDTDEVTIASAKVTDDCEKVTEAAITDTSTDTDVCPTVTASVPAVESRDVPSSNVATTSIHSKGLDSPPQTKHLNEITDTLNAISLQDKSDPSSPHSPTDPGLDTQVLDTCEATEASEAAER